jgi:hypothetical protein
MLYPNCTRNHAITYTNYIYPNSPCQLSLWEKPEAARHSVEPKIRYYKDVTLCENYVRDFFIAAILPVSVKFVI